MHQRNFKTLNNLLTFLSFFLLKNWSFKIYLRLLALINSNNYTMKTKFNGILTLLLAFVVQFSFAQQKTISGTVSDDSGGLPGVSVLIKGTTTGTETNFDGKYSIKAKVGDVLVFTYLGYKTVEKTVAAANTIDVTMIEGGEVLDEVVVVAYGTQSKESLTGSVGTVKTDDLELVRQSNVVQGIVGKVAGVQVINNSGQPGAAPTVRIRGVGSINASSAPLFVVNGVPFQGSITSINQSDIESFSVLKDAAATSLYGSRGANGVIIITTKKGKKGQLSFNADFSTTYSTRATKDYDVITDPRQFYEGHFLAMKNFLINQGNSAADAATIAADNLIIDNAALGYQLGYNITDVPNNQVIDPLTGQFNPNANILYQEAWSDFLFSDSFSNRSFISATGGSENSRVYFSLGHEKNNAFLVNSNFERVTANFSIEQNYKDKFKLGGTINYAHTYQNIPDQGGIAGAFSWSRSIGPIYPVFGYNLDGTPVLDSNGNQVFDFGDGTGGTPQIRNYGSFANPYATALNDIKKRTVDNLNAQAFMEFSFLEDFKFRYNLSADLFSRHLISFDTGIGGDAGNVSGRSTPSATRNFVVTHQQLLTWDKIYGKHSFNALLGHESSYQRNTFLSASKTTFLLPNETVLDQGINIQSVTNNEFEYSVEGYFSRLNYNYDSKYYVNLSYRRDASSVFSPDARWGNFYGAGAAWRISQEDFLEDVSWLNELKFKTSIGQVGNDRIFYPGTTNRNYLAYEDQYTVTNNNGAFGLSLTYQGNDNLTWETSTNFNVGFEVAVLDNNLSIDFEYFSRKVDDLLFNTPQPPSSGLPSFPENVGDMKNTGFEFDINANIINKDDFQLSFNFNGTTFQNEVTALPRDFIDSGVFRYEVGRSIFEYFRREFAGVNPANGAALFYKDILDGSGNPTGERELTENFSEATEYFLGKESTPDLYGGFGMNVRYKNWNLGLNFAYQVGGYGRDNTYFGLLSGSAGTNYHKDLFTETWTVDNTTASLPVVVPNNDLNYYNGSSLQLIDASYLSLQDINLSYDFSTDLTQKLGIDGLRIYTTINNVYLWSKRQGYDPRLSFTGTNGNANFSLVRNATLGVNLKF